MGDDTVDRQIELLLREQGSFAVRDLVDRTGLTRQGLRRHLDRWLESGRLQVEGGGRSTRYRAVAAGVELVRPTAGLREEDVWDDLCARSRGEGIEWGEPARKILQHSVTELVNNAIDHSHAPQVTVRVSEATSRIVVDVVDAGIGAFESVRARFGLDDALHALQEISKGKVTTQPDRHAGEGLFFTSKMVDRLELHANGLSWLVDNIANHQDVVQVATPPGTRVRIEVEPDTDRVPKQVFDRYTTDYVFDRTRTVVRLFEHGVEFVSRSEAKRLGVGLERFREVTVDFAGVESVGQGFADELFRVWASNHPGTRLIPVHMAPDVEFMVRRSLPHPPSP